MKISIITATYNSSKTIQRTLESVKNQTYTNIEHIIIDGLSSDDTISIVNQFVHISKILIEKDNGIYDAINKGIKLATGDIVGILNSDDIFFDEFVIEKIANTFLGNSKISSVIAPIVFYDFMNDKVKRRYSISSWETKCFKFGSMPPHPSFYCYRKLFKEYGYYNTTFSISGDFDLMLRFFLVNDLSYEKLTFYTNKMSLGGVSTKNLKSNLLLNKEIFTSCKINNIKTNYLLIYSKYIWKIFQFIFK
jgi:glycosyltransferase involved in cell wall biosynthesis